MKAIEYSMAFFVPYFLTRVLGSRGNMDQAEFLWGDCIKDGW